MEVRAVVLASGTAELVLPFPGWDLPGVTTAGAAQALLKSQGVTVGRRVLVGGSGPLPEAAGYAAILARHGVPVHTGYAVIACQGTERVERAVIAQLDRDWRPLSGSRREEAVDAVHVSFGLSPALELPRALGCAEVPHPSRPVAAVACDTDLATSVPGVFAAGEVTGASGADGPSSRGTWRARRPRAT